MGGEAWENVSQVRFSNNSTGNGTSSLKLRGDFTFNKNIFLDDTGSVSPSQIGQANDGVTPFDAIFNGNISVTEDDFQDLQLTADADGSATFNGTISIAGGIYGFDKVGDGTAIVTNKVSQSTGDVLPVGPVSVQAGTLLINSPSASGGFNASMITVDAGAILGGTGQVNADVVADGAVAPGASIGNAYGRWKR